MGLQQGRLQARAAGAICALAATVAAASWATGPAPRAGAAQDRPNLIVVMTDDQSVAQMSVLPKVRRLLGDAGTTYDRSFVVWPLCCPSRATFLTGQYPHNHGVRDEFERARGNYLRLRAGQTLPVWLNRAGYRTAHVGKYLNGYGRGGDPREVPVGWDRWVAPVVGTDVRMYEYVLNVDGRLRRYGSKQRDYKTDVFADYATDLLRRRLGAGPVFLSVAPSAPHVEPERGCGNAYDPRPAPRDRGAPTPPLPRPPSFNEADTLDKPTTIRGLPMVDPGCAAKLWRSQLESLMSVDDLVARLVKVVADEGELDRTLFVFTSDNGLLHGEHRVLNGKRLPYEESVRVPLIVRGPGFPAGARRRQLVANVDLAPTLLAAAGARPGRSHVFDGRPLWAPPREELLLEEESWTALRTDDAIYVRHRNGQEELYDLEEDPFELRSRHLSPLDLPLKLRMEQRLTEVEDCAGRECP